MTSNISLITVSEPFLTKAESESTKEEFLKQFGNPEDPLGLLCVKDTKCFVLVPWPEHPYPNGNDIRKDQLWAIVTNVKIALFHHLGGSCAIDIIPDHAQLVIKTKNGGRQMTLLLLDYLKTSSFIDSNGQSTEDPFPGLTIRVALDERFSSKFPEDFTYKQLIEKGYPIKRLAESIGLQLTDIYLGLWKQQNYRGKMVLEIKPRELGSFIKQEIEWTANST